MEVILKKNFNKLGYKNDIVKVKDGYALILMMKNQKLMKNQKMMEI